jgi:hypothetical protein
VSEGRLNANLAGLFWVIAIYLSKSEVVMLNRNRRRSSAKIFMLWRLIISFCALMSAVTIAVPASTAFAGGRPLSAELFGDSEVPGPGDPDGRGLAVVFLNQGQREICFFIEVADIAPVTAAHIHTGEDNEAGPVVVNFDTANNGLSGCVDGVDPALIMEIRQNPEAFYVNVHNADFPPGALRGQLEK